MKRFTSWLFKKLLDLIFPRSALLEELDSLNTEEIYSKCQKIQFVAQNVASFLSYKDKIVKEMLWQIKFNGQRKYAKICGEILYKEIIKKINLQQKYLLVPVPIHKKRRRERGFNQCEWICEEIKKFDTKNLFQYEPNLIERVIYKQKQSWSDRKSRLGNISGVFQIKDIDKIFGKNIIIIDDVVTTGATLNEITKTFNLAAPRKILAFTVAH